jgi:leucyl aminopeptidase (aminopeptidase T)
MKDPRQLALSHAARVLCRTVLRIAAGEHLTIVCDEGSGPLAAVVADAADSIGAWAKRVRLDVIGTRPHKVVPDVLLAALEASDAVVFLASPLHQETPMRQALLHLSGERRVRHAHMPGCTEAAFLAGMRVGYDAVERAGRAMLSSVELARTLSAESPAGTSLRVTLAPGAPWLAQLGVIEPGRWANLPAGALYASPIDVTGVFVADASLGEFFGQREGLLESKPVRLLIDRARVVAVECPASPELRKDVEAMLGFSSNSDRVGLVALGVNFGVTPMGDASVDQNAPGLHLGIGDPAAGATGAKWTAPTCFAACEARSRVLVEGEPVIEGGMLAGRLAPFGASGSSRSGAIVR